MPDEPAAPVIEVSPPVVSTPPPTTPSAPVPAPAAATWIDGSPYDPDRAKAQFDKFRESEKEWKKDHTVLQQLQKVLGVDKSLPTEPAELQAALETERAATAAATTEIRNLRIDGAVSRTVAALGGQADLLTYYLKGTGALDSLDPTAEGFEKTLTALVKTTLEKNPTLKLNGQVPSVSGVPFPAGSGGPSDLISRDTLARMTPQQIADARSAGKLEHLGVGRA